MDDLYKSYFRSGTGLMLGEILPHALSHAFPLSLLIRFFHVHISVNVDYLFYYDNQGLLKQIGCCAMDRSWDNPNHCLASKYDLERGVVDVLYHLPIKLSCNHVKGHQDEETAIEDLP